MLTINNINSGYGKSIVLKNISIKVNKGDIVGLLGANGAGKTTLMKTIIGLIKPYSGEIFFQNNNITKAPPHKISKLGMSIVPEGRKILPQLTVEENLKLGAFSSKMNLDDRLDYVYNLFPILKQRKGQIGSSLSGGEQQMLAIARALMSDPKLLLLDEPSLGLSPKIVEEVFKLIVKLNKEMNVTILIAEQNTKKTIDISTYLYFMVTGTIALSGKKEELKENEVIKEIYLGKKLQ
jgi:branched-chain amino acid transport system ATP-binding protein